MFSTNDLGEQLIELRYTCLQLDSTIKTLDETN